MTSLDKLRKIDKKVTRGFEEFERPYLDQSFKAITSMGSPQLNMILVAGIFLFGQVPHSKILAASLIFSWAVILPSKILIGRKRPEDNEDNFIVSPAFPSGHAGTAFASATALSMLLGKAYFFLGLACLVALSRVYLDDHFFSDVIAGSITGITAGVLAVLMIT